MPLHPQHTSKGASVHCAKYTANGQYLLSGGRDRRVNLWNSESGEHVKAYEAHGYEVLDLAITHDNARFASVGGDKAVFLWDVASGRTVRRFAGHFQRINCVDFNEDGSVLASGSVDATLRLWDCKSSSSRPIQILDEAKDSVSSVVILGALIVVGTVEGIVRTYDMRMGRLCTDVLGPAVTCISLTKDANCALISALDSTLRLMDGADGAVLHRYEGHRNAEFRVRSCFGRDEAMVLSGSEDGGVYVWDVVSGQVVEQAHGHAGVVSCVAHHPSKDQLVTTGADGKMIFWVRS